MILRGYVSCPQGASLACASITRARRASVAPPSGSLHKPYDKNTNVFFFRTNACALGSRRCRSNLRAGPRNNRATAWEGKKMIDSPNDQDDPAMDVPELCEDPFCLPCQFDVYGKRPLAKKILEIEEWSFREYVYLEGMRIKEQQKAGVLAIEEAQIWRVCRKALHWPDWETKEELYERAAARLEGSNNEVFYLVDSFEDTKAVVTNLALEFHGCPQMEIPEDNSRNWKLLDL